MNKLELTENDRQDINILIGLGQSILENENKLAELEAKFEKQSSEYKSTIEALKSTLALEENIYARMNLTTEKIITILLELGDPLEATNFHKQLSTLLTANNNELCTCRIINSLFDRFINDEESALPNAIGCFSVNNRTGKTQQINPESIIKVEEAIKSDVFNTILTFVTIEADRCENYELRKKLIEKKYNLSFINPKVERSLIDQNFEIGELYLTGKAYASINKLDENMYNSCLFKFTKALFDISANRLANMQDKDFTNNNAIANTLKILLKSCLILDNDNFANTLKEQINIQTKFMHKPQTKGLQIILNIIAKIDEDRKLPKVITLKLKRES